MACTGMDNYLTLYHIHRATSVGSLGPWVTTGELSIERNQ